MRTRGWDEGILNDILNERDRELVRQIPLSRRWREDSWFWALDDKGEFTVRSRGEVECLNGLFWRQFWGMKLPGKVVNLIWRACRSCLPTANALAGKSVNVNTQCSWCQLYVEDDIHVLFQCSFAREVWENAGLSNLVMVWPNGTFFTVMQRIFKTGCKEQILMVSLICWNLWQRRNNWVWNHVSTSSFGVRSKACSMLTEWQHAREELKTRIAHHHVMERKWCKPPAGWVKVNTDAACIQGSDQVGVGCVVRDEWGNFVRSRCNTVQGRFQPREAEAIGLRDALSWIKEWRRKWMTDCTLPRCCSTKCRNGRFIVHCLGYKGLKNLPDTVAKLPSLDKLTIWSCEDLEHTLNISKLGGAKKERKKGQEHKRKEK